MGYDLRTWAAKYPGDPEALIDALLQECERLSAPPPHSQASEVEDVAAAIFLAKNGKNAKWDTFPARYKEGYRGLAKAAYAALSRQAPQPAAAMPSGEWRERALQIIADEERYAKNDPPGNIHLHAMRMLRVGTAKQILGLIRMTDLPATDAVLPAAPSAQGKA